MQRNGTVHLKRNMKTFEYGGGYVIQKSSAEDFTVSIMLSVVIVLAWAIYLNCEGLNEVVVPSLQGLHPRANPSVDRAVDAIDSIKDFRFRDRAFQTFRDTRTFLGTKTTNTINSVINKLPTRITNMFKSIFPADTTKAIEDAEIQPTNTSATSKATSIAHMWETTKNARTIQRTLANILASPAEDPFAWINKHMDVEGLVDNEGTRDTPTETTVEDLKENGIKML